MAADLRQAILEAEADPAGQDARVRLASSLAVALRSSGEHLRLVGYMLGTDRRDGLSPFGFGSDGAVGVATVMQIGGELVGGAATLLEHDNAYAATALLRQLVEIEYFAFSFAEDAGEAARWLRSSRAERVQSFQPRHLRQRSGDRFSKSAYQSHCDRGGHPTPDALTLLPGHSAAVPAGIHWCELGVHGLQVWGHLVAACEHFGSGDLVRSSAVAAGLPEAEAA